MQYRNYGKTGYQVSALGLGCMRLPRLPVAEGAEQAEVDREKAYELIRYAAENGINYFDTAYSYHNMDSEAVLGEALDHNGLRAKVKIATKQPFAAMKDVPTIRKNLENTLKKLRTDYIDVYLMHNIQESTWEAIQQMGVIEEFMKFKEEGLIREIGFSYHGALPTFRDVLAKYDWAMCQVQHNLMDVDAEVTNEGLRLAGQKGCALVIMEPLRGGGLANAPGPVKALYDSYPVKRTPAEWAFRNELDYPEVSTILSGMTTMEQLKENIEIFSKPDAVPNCLNAEEKRILTEARKAYESLTAVRCTGCEYCMPCPQNVDIPGVFDKYNAGTMFEDFAQPRRSYMFTMRGGASADHCVECGVCEGKCPQGLPIIEKLKDAHKVLAGWVD